ncbi:MAG: hypothetical protein ACD_4C00441G0008 [uncultured bacterium (gcode 4)]|uniref:Uncharacterized protein n=1 Tax=uncultured bacterium (gcode 4) TaxID=1234023 RepID=K2GS10_9BACT|nr:MAG: hypothetical protein ACD_4C00441G0008 [uncultured bacterium (gcode 4)]
MKKSFINKKWSAFIVSIFIVAIVSITAIYLLDKIVPFSQNTKWIENSNKAYYNALSWVEEALSYMSGSNPSFETWANHYGLSSAWYVFQISASWAKLPHSWEWNSEFDSNYNKIWIGEPIQLVINKWLNWSQIKFYFKVPNLDWTNPSLSSSLNWSGVINWILSWSWRSLYASWESNMITWTTASSWIISLWNLNWTDSNWYGSWFQAFSDNLDCGNLTNKCSLKLSINHPLYLLNWSAPYLEYKIDWNSNFLPLQYAKIESDWYSFWFKKNIKKDIQQLTTNDVFNVTVVQ